MILALTEMSAVLLLASITSKAAPIFHYGLWMELPVQWTIVSIVLLYGLGLLNTSCGQMLPHLLLCHTRKLIASCEILANIYY